MIQVHRAWSPNGADRFYNLVKIGFFDDTRDSYVPSAATDAWARTLAWFRQYLT